MYLVDISLICEFVHCSEAAAISASVKHDADTDNIAGCHNDNCH